MLRFRSFPIDIRSTLNMFLDFSWKNYRYLGICSKLCVCVCQLQGLFLWPLLLWLRVGDVQRHRSNTPVPDAWPHGIREMSRTPRNLWEVALGTDWVCSSWACHEFSAVFDIACSQTSCSWTLGQTFCLLAGQLWSNSKVVIVLYPNCLRSALNDHGWEPCDTAQNYWQLKFASPPFPFCHVTLCPRMACHPWSCITRAAQQLCQRAAVLLQNSATVMLAMHQTNQSSKHHETKSCHCYSPLLLALPAQSGRGIWKPAAE